MPTELRLSKPDQALQTRPPLLCTLQSNPEVMLFLCVLVYTAGPDLSQTVVTSEETQGLGDTRDLHRLGPSWDS